jgi:simple sugar transport system ATP-binding protein
MVILEVDGLSKSFGGVKALSSISFSLERGTALALLGNNGAGKSTLLQCITGALRYDSGSIRSGAESLPPGSPGASRAAGIEMIYQSLHLCPQHSVAQNIFIGREPRLTLGPIATPLLDLHGMRRRSVEILKRLDIELDPDAIVGNLSGGQQQAVAIARALVSNPKLLILDEPTAALGVKESANVLALIRTLKAEGIAILLVSHRLTDIFQVADSILLLRHGFAVFTCTTADTTPEQVAAALSAGQ